MQLGKIKLALAFAVWPLIIAVGYHFNPELTVLLTTTLVAFVAMGWSGDTILTWLVDRQQRARRKD